MSKILISGCGLSWSKQERSTWTKVIRLCGVDIDDQAGPAISNQLILTSMIQAVMENDYSQAVCQLTSTEKLDVEVNNDSRKDLVAKDPIRNFTHKGYWPSSVSQHHDSKKMFYEYLYSPTLEQQDTVFKWMLLQKLCAEKGIKLHTILGYKINWMEGVQKDLIATDHNWNIYDYYTNGEYWKLHDHSLGEKNTVPNKYFQIHLAKKINNEMLKLPINEKLERFHD